MLFKMVGIERTWKQYPDMWDKPRQIFVTQSRILATKVEEYFLKLMLSVEAASYTPEELREMSTNFEKEMEYIDLDDMEQWRSDLPTKFSELSDGNFPLFITYERVCVVVSISDPLSLMNFNTALFHAPKRHWGRKRQRWVHHSCDPSNARTWRLSHKPAVISKDTTQGFFDKCPYKRTF